MGDHAEGDLAGAWRAFVLAVADELRVTAVVCWLADRMRGRRKAEG
jgi:hypothetical protein